MIIIIAIKRILIIAMNIVRMTMNHNNRNKQLLLW